MKGIVLAGGNGRRLDPITNITNKHLLPVYDKPMIYYPLNTLIKAGIREILVVCGSSHADKFSSLLGMGENFGCKFSYAFQNNAGGIAQALGLAESFVGKDNVAVILGDNIFEDDFSAEISGFDKNEGAGVFLKEVHDPQRFGVAEIVDDKIVDIEEKPANPKSNYAVTGLYLYDNTVFKTISMLNPSARGEYEITDVNNTFVHSGQMKAYFVKGEWTDAGTFESLFHANRVARRLSIVRTKSTSKMIK